MILYANFVLSVDFAWLLRYNFIYDVINDFPNDATSRTLADAPRLAQCALQEYKKCPQMIVTDVIQTNGGKYEKQI